MSDYFPVKMVDTDSVNNIIILITNISNQSTESFGEKDVLQLHEISAFGFYLTINISLIISVA